MEKEKDGGLLSRKWILVLFAILVVTLMAFAAAKWAGVSAVYGTLCGTVSALVALYLGANSTVKTIMGKMSKDKPQDPSTKK